jgi:hypothetical protein
MYDRCKLASEMASPVLCDCEALAVLRFRHLGHHLLKLGDFADNSVTKVLHFVWSAGLLNVQAKGCTKDRKWSRGMGNCRAHPTVLYSKHFMSGRFENMARQSTPTLPTVWLWYSIKSCVCGCRRCLQHKMTKRVGQKDFLQKVWCTLAGRFQDWVTRNMSQAEHLEN